LATYTSHIELRDGGLRVERLVEGGKEILWSPLPLVLTVVKEIAHPRLPTLGGILRSKQVEVPVWGPEQIDANPEWIGLNGSPTRVVKISKPKLTRKGEVVRIKDPADTGKAIDRLVQLLRERQLIS